MSLISTIITFIKNWKVIFIPLVIIVLLGGIYLDGKADGKREYKVKATARMEALRATSQAAHDALQKKADDTAAEFEAWKTAQQKTKTEVDKDYENAVIKKTINACFANAEFVRIYGITGYNSGAESKATR